jgi:hypothetical protein
MVSSWDGEQMVKVCEYRDVGIEEQGVDVGGLEDARAHFSDHTSLVAGFEAGMTMCGAGRQDKSSGVIRARKQHKLASACDGRDIDKFMSHESLL